MTANKMLTKNAFQFVQFLPCFPGIVFFMSSMITGICPLNNHPKSTNKEIAELVNNSIYSHFCSKIFGNVFKCHCMLNRMFVNAN